MASPPVRVRVPLKMSRAAIGAHGSSGSLTAGAATVMGAAGSMSSVASRSAAFTP